MLWSVRVCPRCKATYVVGRAHCLLDNAALVETQHDPWVGTELERYAIVEHLGSGGMGRVYRARHVTLEREYAIKILYGDLAIDDTFSSRFRREAQAINSIRHPNVVSVSDFGITESGLSFIVMELLLGRTIRAAIQMDGPFLPVRAGRVTRQILAALEVAHEAGYVHRDIKPTNVIISGRPPNETVKVLDFGTVSLVQQPLDIRLTAIGQIIGTPAYMAPEQFEDPAVGPSADLYSLGILLHQMLAGRLPFTGTSPTELMVQHMTQPPPKLPSLHGLERLVADLLQKDPTKRPSSAREVSERLEALDLETATTDGFNVDTEHSRPPITTDTAPAELVGLEGPTEPPEEEDQVLLAPDAPGGPQVLESARTVKDSSDALDRDTSDLVAETIPIDDEMEPPPQVDTLLLTEPAAPAKPAPPSEPFPWVYVIAAMLSVIAVLLVLIILN